MQNNKDVIKPKLICPDCGKELIKIDHCNQDTGKFVNIWICDCISEMDMPNDNRQTEWKEYRKQNGFDERETWTLYMSLANWFLPRFKLFKKQLHPDELESNANIFDNIEFSFKCLLNGFRDYNAINGINENYGITNKEQYEKRFRKGFKLLGKYIRSFWW